MNFFFGVYSIKILLNRKVGLLIKSDKCIHNVIQPEGYTNATIIAFQ